MSGLKVVQSSGDVMLDRPAYGDIASSNPFAALPTEFKGPYFGLRLSFYYNLSPSPRNSSMAPHIGDVLKKLNENLSKDNNAKTDLEHDVAALTKLLDAGNLDLTDAAAARDFRASAQTLLNVYRNKDGLSPDTAVNEQRTRAISTDIIAGKANITAWGTTMSDVAYTASTIAWNGLRLPAHSYLRIGSSVWRTRLAWSISPRDTLWDLGRECSPTPPKHGGSSRA